MVGLEKQCPAFLSVVQRSSVSALLHGDAGAGGDGGGDDGGEGGEGGLGGGGGLAHWLHVSRQSSM